MDTFRQVVPPKKGPSSKSTTFRTCNKQAEQHPAHNKKSGPIQEKIKSLPQYEKNKCTEILQMSSLPGNVCVSKNGFVHTLIDAYNRYNLVIRPDDVWEAIMTQFSFYVNKNAEEFRTKFVNFEGKKELKVMICGSLKTASYDTFVHLMTEQIDKNLVDPEVKGWILPNFSTTSANDLVTIGIVFIATMKKYFDYKCRLYCGIPSVTLEGTVEDWENVHGRLEKLKEYKLEAWYDLLEPIISQFVNAKKGKVDEAFWQKIAHRECNMSGPSYISGWTTAFCVFNREGNWIRQWNSIDEKWPKIDISDIPTGIVEVDLKIDDNGVEYKSVMFAGHLATEIKDDGCTIQPTLGWAIALKPNE